MKNKCGIYKIINNINNKIYIGQSINIPQRIRIHFSTKSKNTPLYNAIKKYGKENFIVEIIEYCDKELLNSKEQLYIKQYNCMVPYGYNLTSGGGSGHRLCAESREKMSFIGRLKTGERTLFMERNIQKQLKIKLVNPKKEYHLRRDVVLR